MFINIIKIFNTDSPLVQSSIRIYFLTIYQSRVHNRIANRISCFAYAQVFDTHTQAHAHTHFYTHINRLKKRGTAIVHSVVCCCVFSLLLCSFHPVFFCLAMLYDFLWHYRNTGTIVYEFIRILHIRAYKTHVCMRLCNFRPICRAHRCCRLCFWCSAVLSAYDLSSSIRYACGTFIIFSICCTLWIDRHFTHHDHRLLMISVSRLIYLFLFLFLFSLPIFFSHLSFLTALFYC